jgi:hypothetical protein
MPESHSAGYAQNGAKKMSEAESRLQIDAPVRHTSGERPTLKAVVSVEER